MNGDLPAPRLTLDPDSGEGTEEKALEKIGGLSSGADFKEVRLTEDEMKTVDEFAEKIELRDSNMIVRYGAGAQKKMTDFSESALSLVRTKDLGAIGAVLTGVVSELKGFDTAEKSGGILGFFKRPANKIETLKIKYDKAEANIDKVCEILEKHQMELMKDISMLDKMFELNKVYFKEISMYILAGKKKLEQVRAGELAELEARARETGRQEDVQAASDLASLCDRFEKKLHDLELTRAVSLQMGPQIRMVQGNNILMTEKIQSTLANTIPLWKSQMVISIGIAHSMDAARAQQAVSETTNELLRRNAENLQTATVQTAKESERSIIDIETLRYTNEKLISTLDDVLRIQDEGRQKRRQAETELLKIENELKERLLRIRK